MDDSKARRGPKDGFSWVQSVATRQRTRIGSKTVSSVSDSTVESSSTCLTLHPSRVLSFMLPRRRECEIHAVAKEIPNRLDSTS